MPTTVFSGQTDLDRMTMLVNAYPDSALHVVDLPYRLASWALNDARNIGLWEDEHGQLIGWGVVQSPFSTIDMMLHPDHPKLEAVLIEWGIGRCQQIAQERGQSSYMCVLARNDHPEKASQLERHGLQLGNWGLLHLSRSNDAVAPQSQLPDGFSIRSLDGEREVSAYVALHRAAFQSENMTEDWRLRIVRRLGYRADLDRVAVAPDGSLAAFCIGWLHNRAGQITGQIEPLGVLPDYQGIGLGRALLTDTLRQVQAAGAITTLIEAESNNPTSQALYRSVGFQSVYETTAYYKVFDPSSS